MRTIVDIYEAYRIPPWLQEHQLRVAAVGKLVCGIRPEADERQVVLAGLLHDMGNILKFDFVPDGPLAPLMAEKGMEYWQQVQDDFLRTYGPDEHAATVAIVQELGLPETIVGLVDGIGLSRMDIIKREGPLELQMAGYADMRVGPFGILPARERVADIKKRYAVRWAQGHENGIEEKLEINIAAIAEIETGLFQGAPLRPDDIHDVSVAPVINELKKYEIS